MHVDDAEMKIGGAGGSCQYGQVRLCVSAFVVWFREGYLCLLFFSISISSSLPSRMGRYFSLILFRLVCVSYCYLLFSFFRPSSLRCLNSWLGGRVGMVETTFICA